MGKRCLIKREWCYLTMELADFNLRKINPSLLSRHPSRLLCIWLQASAPKRGSCAPMKRSPLPCRGFTVLFAPGQARSADAMCLGGTWADDWTGHRFSSSTLLLPKLIMGAESSGLTKPGCILGHLNVKCRVTALCTGVLGPQWQPRAAF